MSLPVSDNLIFHVDASDSDSITKDANDNVSQWDDLSGENNHATQSTAARQPKWVDDEINGKPAMQFVRTSSQFFTMGTNKFRFSRWDKFTLFAVFKTENENLATLIGNLEDSGNFRGWDLVQAAGAPEYHFINLISNLNSRTMRRTNTEITTGEVLLESVTYDGSSSAAGINFYIDGELTGMTTNIDTQNSNGMEDTTAIASVGSRNGGGAYFDGYIAEILLYEDELSDSDREDVEQYLGEKWLGWDPDTIEVSGQGQTFATGQGAIKAKLQAEGQGSYTASSSGVIKAKLQAEGQGSYTASGSGAIDIVDVITVSGEGSYTASGTGAIKAKLQASGAGVYFSTASGAVEVVGKIFAAGQGLALAIGSGSVQAKLKTRGGAIVEASGLGDINAKLLASGQCVYFATGSGAITGVTVSPELNLNGFRFFEHCGKWNLEILQGASGYVKLTFPFSITGGAFSLVVSDCFKGEQVLELKNGQGIEVLGAQKIAIKPSREDTRKFPDTFKGRYDLHLEITDKTYRLMGGDVSVRPEVQAWT